MIQEILKETKQKMEKTLTAFQAETAKLRTGRANLAILDDVRVNYYGQPSPLAQVATLGTPEPRLITVSPWEANLIPEIEKAIGSSGLGLNPTNDGKMIRIPIPQLTEERRKELVKLLKGYSEEGKVSIRHSRREAIDQLKDFEKEEKSPRMKIKKPLPMFKKSLMNSLPKLMLP